MRSTASPRQIYGRNGFSVLGSFFCKVVALSLLGSAIAFLIVPFIPDH